MKKKMIMSIVCAMALLFTAGCSGNEVSESAQQNNAPAAAAESTVEPSGQKTVETDTTEASGSAAEASGSAAEASSGRHGQAAALLRRQPGRRKAKLPSKYRPASLRQAIIFVRS